MRFILSVLCLLVFSSAQVSAQEIVNINALGNFYQERGGEPYWLEQGALNERGATLLKTLHNSWQNGLNPKRYHIEIMNKIISHKDYAEVIGTGRAMDLELLLSDAYILYAQDVSASRILAQAKTLSLRENDWQKPPAAKALLEKLDSAQDHAFDDYLSSFEPQGYVYQKLKEMLIDQEALSEAQYNQIIVNMERLRWIPSQMPERYIMVNIAAAHLWAIDKGAVAIDMPVAVGRSKRQTAVFVTHVEGVRLNPSWTVPETIKREDILPKLAQDNNYLLHKGMELYQGYGRDSVTLDPTSISWDQMSVGDLRNLRFVQLPGDANPLGRYRVLMPNQYDIYLHDTNEKYVFDQPYDKRAVSSGCVRMEDPAKLVSFILSGRDYVPHFKIRQILDSGRESELYTQENIPVYMLYYTLWPGDNSEITFGKDPYDRDKKLLQVLEKLDAFQKFSNTQAY